jgi:hypothetical protein
MSQPIDENQEKNTAEIADGELDEVSGGAEEEAERHRVEPAREPGG